MVLHGDGQEHHHLVRRTWLGRHLGQRPPARDARRRDQPVQSRNNPPNSSVALPAKANIRPDGESADVAAAVVPEDPRVKKRKSPNSKTRSRGEHLEGTREWYVSRGCTV